jgi:hypothetical protein
MSPDPFEFIRLALGIYWVLSILLGWPMVFYLLSQKFWNPPRRPDLAGLLGLALLCWFVTALFAAHVPCHWTFPEEHWLRYTVASCGVAVMSGLPWALVLARVADMARQRRGKSTLTRGTALLGILSAVALLSQVFLWLAENQRWPFPLALKL